jgi:hypothetical protein
MKRNDSNGEHPVTRARRENLERMRGLVDRSATTPTAPTSSSRTTHHDSNEHPVDRARRENLERMRKLAGG